MSSAMTAALRQTVNIGRMQGTAIRRCMTSVRNNTIPKSPSFIPATNTNWTRAQHTTAAAAAAAVHTTTTMRPHPESSPSSCFSTTPKTAQMEIDHFRSIPWVAKHLSKPHLVITQADSRKPKPGHCDVLFSQTLNSPETISAYITTVDGSEEGLITETLAFLTLGNKLNGWPGVCHGGMVMAMMDDLTGQLFTQNKKLKRMQNLPLMTAYLNTTFVKPVRTPCTIMVRCRITKVEGRKYWSEAAIIVEDEVTGEEVELARCDSLFVMLKSNL
ncbi:HotDog domain-containing protein [Neurospora hispaniola]|uniref:HotDog domain-containing protein n=1 Tax=Neurospora hispaniola TaxID=588809 RepID=A0AAJ0MW13_9PEZI|nr:HotDog domain-containing protein [Neurospora hispaniola]